MGGDKKDKEFSTRAIHVGTKHYEGSVNTPIFQSSTNKQFFSKSDYRYIYEKISRLNPIFTPNFYEFKTLFKMIYLY